MIKPLLLTPFIVVLGLILLFWLAVAILAVVVLAFVLCPVVSLVDQSINVNATPSKYAQYVQ